MAPKIKNIGIIGDGGWGTTLAVYLAEKGYSVTVWGPFADYTREVQRSRYNSKFLPDVRLPESILFTDQMARAVEICDVVVLATP